ncbi:hypothetical protein EV1_041361 [Malus domestica]
MLNVGEGLKHGGCRTLEWQRKARSYQFFQACSDIWFLRRIKLVSVRWLKDPSTPRIFFDDFPPEMLDYLELLQARRSYEFLGVLCNCYLV